MCTGRQNRTVGMVCEPRARCHAKTAPNRILHEGHLNLQWKDAQSYTDSATCKCTLGRQVGGMARVHTQTKHVPCGTESGAHEATKAIDAASPPLAPELARQDPHAVSSESQARKSQTACQALSKAMGRAVCGHRNRGHVPQACQEATQTGSTSDRIGDTSWIRRRFGHPPSRGGRQQRHRRVSELAMHPRLVADTVR